MWHYIKILLLHKNKKNPMSLSSALKKISLEFTSVLNIFFNLIFIDKYEKTFLNKVNLYEKPFNKINRETVFIEAIPDYYYLAYYLATYDQMLKNYDIIAYWTDDTIHTERKSKNFYIRIYREVRSTIFHFLLKRKWLKLYSSLGVKTFFDYNEIKKNISHEKQKKLDKKSFKIFSKLRNKKEVLNIKIDKIQCGDLIYDTYLTFRNEPTVDIKDSFLLKVISRSHTLKYGLESFIKQRKINHFFLPFSSYIIHGIPAKVALDNNICVYTDGNYQYNKKLTKTDFRHVENIDNFKKIFSTLKNKNKKLIFAKHLVQDHFRESDNKYEKRLYNYMDFNPYGKNTHKNEKKYDIIIFLPHFFETQREWGKIIFNDFYEWINFTLNFYNKSIYKVAIKLHPNTYSINPESLGVVNELKTKYPNFVWLDSKYSNLEIFKKVKFAISPWGSVLWELAYFGIKSVCIGDYPGKKYNLSYLPKNKKHYEFFLKNFKKLKKNRVNRNKIFEFIYVYMVNNNDAYDNLARKIEMKKIDFTHSKSLQIVLKKLNFIK